MAEIGGGGEEAEVEVVMQLGAGVGVEGRARGKPVRGLGQGCGEAGVEVCGKLAVGVPATEGRGGGEAVVV